VEQNKAFPNDNRHLLTTLLRTVPLLGGGAAALVIGYRLAALIPPELRIYLMILFLGCLIGIIILEKEPGWNVVLFLAFTVSAGLPLYWSGVTLSLPKAWILFVILVLISLAGSISFSLPSSLGGIPFVLITVIYVIGWITFSFFQLSETYFSIWIYVGLVLFTTLAAGIFSRVKTAEKERGTLPLAIELFIVFYNLYWLSGIVWQLG